MRAMPIVIAILVILLVIFTWPFWVGLLLIAGPIIPAFLVVLILGLVSWFVGECWKDRQRRKAVSHAACKQCGAAPGEPCIGKEVHEYHPLRLQAAKLIPEYYNLD